MSAYAYADRVLRETLTKENMPPRLSGGALLALSGGKDSVLLLSLFARYAKENDISFAAFHLHHGIRGAEADRDADFCRSLCASLSVPLTVAYADIPGLAKERGTGLEETARAERYRLLEQTAREQGFGAVLTAHTATDLAETVLLHLFRGGGGRALCGIPPVRALGEGLFVLRPLIALSAKEIEAALAEKNIPFVFDSTNDDTAFRRNYVRRELFPRLLPVCSAPEAALCRMAENLRGDMDYLDGEAKSRFDTLYDGEGLDSAAFLSLPSALSFRVFRLFWEREAPEASLPERVHLVSLLSRLEKEGDFSLSFPGGISVQRRGKRLFLGEEQTFTHPATVLKMGCNRLADGALLWLLDETSTPPPENIYTLSIQRTLASATIEGELTVRSRKEGDAYRYGGMTHKLKKLFSDRKIPTCLRSHLPVLCDGRGILWVPGFGERDDGVKNKKALTAVYLAADRVPTDLTVSSCTNTPKP